MTRLREDERMIVARRKASRGRLARLAAAAGAVVLVSALFSLSGCVAYHDEEPRSELDAEEAERIEQQCSYSRVGPHYKSQAPTHLPYDSACAKALRKSNYKNENISN